MLRTESIPIVDSYRHRKIPLANIIIIFLIKSSQFSCAIARLSECIWTTTLRGAADQELSSKLRILFSTGQDGKNYSVLSSRNLWLNLANILDRSITSFCYLPVKSVIASYLWSIIIVLFKILLNVFYLNIQARIQRCSSCSSITAMECKVITEIPY